MPTIYEQHDATFRHVSAFVILRDGERVATVAFKFATSGLSVTAFVHWIGTEMVRGVARGGGYDRKTAACAHAAARLLRAYQMRDCMAPDYLAPESAAPFEAFRYALARDTGPTWDAQLQRAGFTVLQAV